MSKQIAQLYVSISRGPSGVVVAQAACRFEGDHWEDRHQLWARIFHDQDSFQTEREWYEYVAELLMHRAENYTQTHG